MVTRIWCIRHGEVEAPYVGTFVGTTNVALSDVGKHQAEAIAAFLEDAPLDAVYVSPRKRAQQTAAPLVAKRSLPVESRPDLAEMDFGRWEGLSWPQIVDQDSDVAAVWQSDPGSTPCPEGDTANDFAARVQADIERLVERHDGQTIALFVHAGVNRAILAAAVGIPYMQSFAFAQDYGCINAIEWDGEARQVALLNVVPGPASSDNGDGGRVVEEQAA